MARVVLSERAERREATHSRQAAFDPLTVVLWGLSLLLLAFIILPLLRLALTPTSTDVLQVARADSVGPAIWLSVQDAALATLAALFGGVPLGYLLAGGRVPAARVVQALVDLPLAVPHSVAGIALLLVLGRRGWIGGPAGNIGLKFFGSQVGIVAAMLFVSVPFMVGSARAAFAGIDPVLDEAARADGAGRWEIFRRIALPLAAPGIIAGLSLTYARAIAEFGAVVVLAYYPMTAPVKVYDLFLQGGLQQSAAAALLLLAVTLTTFLALRAVADRRFGALVSSAR